MAAMLMWMRSKKHWKLMMDRCRMCSTEGIVSSTWEPVMLTSMSARMAMMQIQMWKKKHRKPMMD